MDEKKKPSRHGFPITGTSLILLAATFGHPDSRRAIETFLQQYRKPLYDRARKAGLSEDDADEVVQLLQIRIVEKNLLAQWDPKKAPLHVFLLACLKTGVWHFLRARDARPGGKMASLDAEIGVDGAALKDMLPHPDALEHDEDYQASWLWRILNVSADALASTGLDPIKVRILKEYVIQLEDTPSAQQMADALNVGRPKEDHISPGAVRVDATRLRDLLLLQLDAEIARQKEEGHIPEGEVDGLLAFLERYIDKGGKLGDK